VGSIRLLGTVCIGNYRNGKIYCGRRDGAIDEYDLKVGFERKIWNPKDSGAVSLVKMMPNGRHLLWFVDLTPVALLTTCACGT
jgi:hypothetical protein